MTDVNDLVAEIRSARRLPNRMLARAIRKACGISQARLAKELGVGRVTVTRWESGRRTPRGRLARAYGELLATLRDEAGK